MLHFWVGRLWLFVGIFIFSIHASADGTNSFENILQDALKGYIERKADEAGLIPDKPGKEQAADKVSLQFSGAEVPQPDVFASLVTESSSPDTGSNSKTSVEQDCYNEIQGKIAWNEKGNKSWGKSNVQRLCKGTTKVYAPGDCFRYAMFNGSAWGKKAVHKMNWSRAIKLCAGTNDGRQTTDCFKARIAAADTLDNAIKKCAKPQLGQNLQISSVINMSAVAQVAKNEEDSCYKYVQGKIAWDNKGKQKKWGSANVKRLCKGTTSTYSPGNCFKYAMFNGKDWGKKASDVMNWSKAIDLCEGISNAKQATTCFKNKIATGKNVDQAINSCQKKGS